jgi:cell division protein FtsA
MIKDYLKIFTIDVEKCITNGLAICSVLLLDEEKIGGAMAISIGVNKTNIGVMYKGKLVFETCISIGGQDITKEISKLFNVSKEIAEEIKSLNSHMFFNIRYNSELIKINIDTAESYSIGQTKVGVVGEVVRQKIEEIINASIDEVRKNGLLEFIKNIVLTGGTSLFHNIESIVFDITNINTRVGVVENFNLKSSDFDISNIRQPPYYSVIGILKIISQKQNY